MDNEKLYHAELIKDLLKYEREEVNLIELYKTLLDVGVADCLPDNEKRTFKESLETLFHDSEKHQRMVASLTSKFKND